MMTIEIRDAGPANKATRYVATVRAERYGRDLDGPGAATKAQAKENVIADALAIASFEPIRVTYGDGSRSEVACTGVGGYSVQRFGADGRPGGATMTSDLDYCVLEAGRLGAFHGGVGHISIGAYGAFERIRIACDAEAEAQRQAQTGAIS